MASGMELAYRQAARMRRKGDRTRVIVLSEGDANIGSISHEGILRRIRARILLAACSVSVFRGGPPPPFRGTVEER